MKKGDEVIIKDSSYSKVVTDHGLESGYGDGEIRNIKNEQGTIIETGCEFPDRHEHQVRNRTSNDTVVMLDSGKVVFIEERFLKLVPPTHKIMIGVENAGYTIFGKIIEISDKLYQEIKHESQA